MLTDVQDINEHSREFYSENYSSKSTATPEDFNQCFDSFQFPKLNAAFKESLDLDLLLIELQNAIIAPPGGGWHRRVLDGFIKPLMGSSLTKANICVLLIKDKDETEPGSYRPIGLLNCDL